LSALPPLESLLEVHERLVKAGIEHALGASALLHAHGLGDHVGDWDINTDATHDVLDPLFEDLNPVHFGSSGIHADSKMQMFDRQVELIVRMAIVADGQIVRIPTLPRTTWNGVPVGSLEAWAISYTLLGRTEKADKIFQHLATRGAHSQDVERMLQEPLPENLAARLSGLLRV
jgi:hypothetical protein